MWKRYNPCSRSFCVNFICGASRSRYRECSCVSDRTINGNTFRMIYILLTFTLSAAFKILDLENHQLYSATTRLPVSAQKECTYYISAKNQVVTSINNSRLCVVYSVYRAALKSGKKENDSNRGTDQMKTMRDTITF